MSNKQNNKKVDKNKSKGKDWSSDVAIPIAIPAKNIETDSDNLLELFLDHLKEEHNFSPEKINDLIQKKREDKREKILIPLHIFNKKLSSLETIVKYLKEILSLKDKKIADLLNRNVRTVWTTYHNAIEKHPERFSKTLESKSSQKKIKDKDDNKHDDKNEKEKESQLFIPVFEFKNRDFSVLEVIVKYLKENCRLTFSEISSLIKRNPNTIWTVYNRVKRKVMKKRREKQSKAKR